jgi:hypothetical protein
VAFGIAAELAGACQLVDRFTGADPEKGPVGRQGGQRGEGLRDVAGVVAVGRTGDTGADGGGTGALAHQAQRDPGEAAVRLIVLPGLEVVASPDEAEPGLLGGDRELHQLRGGELLVGEHESDLLGRSTCLGTCGGCARGAAFCTAGGHTREGQRPERGEAPS